MFWSFFLFSIFLLWRVSRFRFGAVFVFSVLYVVGYYVGIPYYLSAENLDEKTSRLLVLSSSLFLISFLAGAYLSEKTVNFDFIGRFFYYGIIKFPGELSVYKKIRVFFVVALGFIVGGYYFRYGVPYFSNSPDEARFKAAAGATPFFFLLTYLSPMYVFILVGNKGTAVKLVSYSVVLIVSFLTAFKSAPAKLVLAYMIAKERYYSPKLVLKVFFFLALLVLFYAITYLKYRGLDADQIWRNVFFRLFFVNIKNAVYVLENFNYSSGFLWGGAFLMDLTNYLPGSGDTFGVWLNKQIYGYENVSTNPSFTALWADMGWYMIVPMFFMGISFQSIDKIFKKIKLNGNEKIFWAFFVLTLGFSSTNPYAKNLYFTAPFIIYLVVTKIFILMRFK